MWIKKKKKKKNVQLAPNIHWVSGEEVVLERSISYFLNDTTTNSSTHFSGGANFQDELTFRTSELSGVVNFQDEPTFRMS